jgi:predicted secreted Zn-dependent protease
MKENLQAECQQFAADYVTTFRNEVAAFCDQVIEANGQVHGKTLQAIRRKIDHFHAMNVFNDVQTAKQLRQLKSQLFGITGETSKSSRTWRKSSARPALRSSRMCSIRRVCRLSPGA